MFINKETLVNQCIKEKYNRFIILDGSVNILKNNQYDSIQG